MEKSIWSGELTSSATDSGRGRKKKARFREKLPIVQRRLRVVKMAEHDPAVAVCTLCSREFKVPLSALKRTADAQASLQEQLDRHKCEPDDSSQSPARVAADVLLCYEPDEEEDEDDRKRMMTMTRATATRNQRKFGSVLRPVATSQDTRKLLSEARADPRLMSGTMTSSSTVTSDNPT